MKNIKILVCNDDGYQAPGIVALYEALKTIPGTDIEVIAPEQNNSAKSNALTLHSPLYVHTAANGFRYINGTPADCMHIALLGLLDYCPDIVVSGINNGANMGDDTIYSGTVGAAMEAYLFGIPAIAFSQVERGWTHIDDAAQWAKTLVVQLLPALQKAAAAIEAQQIESQQQTTGPIENPAADTPPMAVAIGENRAWLLNVNIPNLPKAEIHGVKVTRLGRRHNAEPVITQTSPRGDTMYWIGNAGAAREAGEGTDFHATEQGYVSITPLQVDLTDHERLPYWAQTASRLSHPAD